MSYRIVLGSYCVCLFASMGCSEPSADGAVDGAESGFAKPTSSTSSEPGETGDESNTGSTSGSAESSSSASTGDESTGPAPLPSCELHDGLSAGASSYDAAAIVGQDGKSSFFDFETTCVPQPAVFSMTTEGRPVTEAVLDCEAVVQDGEEPPDAPIPLTFRASGVWVELGTDPLDLAYYYDFPWDHVSGDEVSSRFALHRDGQLLVLSFTNHNAGIVELGATAVTSESSCTAFDVCGLPRGIQATAFDGGTVEDTTGAPMSLNVGGREVLVSARGIEPEVCPDGTEPYDGTSWLRVVAVDSSLLVD